MTSKLHGGHSRPMTNTTTTATSSDDSLNLHRCGSSADQQYQPKQRYQSSSIQLLRATITSYESHDSLDRICHLSSHDALREMYKVVLTNQQQHQAKLEAAASAAAVSPPSQLIPLKPLPQIPAPGPQFVYRSKRAKRVKRPSEGKSVWSRLKRATS